MPTVDVYLGAFGVTVAASRGRWIALLAALLVLARPLPALALVDSSPTHALESAPSGLYLAHGATGHVHRYALRKGQLVQLAARRVCAEPLAVRAHSTLVYVVCSGEPSLHELDARTLAGRRRIALPGEAADLLIDRGRAYLSLPQARALATIDLREGLIRRVLPLAMSEPRLLARWGDSLLVLAYRSGNGSTVLPGSVVDRQQLASRFNVAAHPASPARGRNPVPQHDGQFIPPLDSALPRPPQSGHIVREGRDGRWRDDAGHDWTAFVSGEYAPTAGRSPGWKVPDHDLAIVSPEGEPRYRRALITHGLALAVDEDRVLLAGIEAHNEIRFEPRLRGRFVSHRLLAGPPETLDAEAARDLNPQIDAEAQGDPDEALAEVRALLPVGDSLFLAAAGSDRIAVLDSTGRRETLIELPGAPVAMAMHEGVLVVFARDRAELVLVDPKQHRVTGSLAIRPAPAAELALGRRWLSNARLTSANGTQSCNGCHIDGHVDRLAWDLGDPGGAMKPFAGNCFTSAARACADWHPMKGPMVTQSLRGIIGSEPFHWRGDRRGLADFRQTYTALLGREQAPGEADIAQLAAYLRRLRVPRNPYLNPDGRLPTALNLAEIPAIGRPRGERWPIGNAARGLERFHSEPLAPPFTCIDCHRLPNGLAPADRGKAGGEALPAGPQGEAHHGLSSLAGLGQTFKVPALTGLHDRLNPYVGIGFGHDGSLLTLADFLRFRNLKIADEQAEADLLALLVAFDAEAVAAEALRQSTEP